MRVVLGRNMLLRSVVLRSIVEGLSGKARTSIFLMIASDLVLGSSLGRLMSTWFSGY